MDEETAQKEGPQGGPFLFVASPGRDEIIYIPGTGMRQASTKLTVGIMPAEDAEATDLRRWFSRDQS